MRLEEAEAPISTLRLLTRLTLSEMVIRSGGLSRAITPLHHLRRLELSGDLTVLSREDLSAIGTLHLLEGISLGAARMYCAYVYH